MLAVCGNHVIDQCKTRDTNANWFRVIKHRKTETKAGSRIDYEVYISDSNP